VLKYVVDGVICIDRMTKIQMEELAAEFDFYSINIPEELEDALTNKTLKNDPAPPVKWVCNSDSKYKLNISNGGKTVTNIEKEKNILGHCMSVVFGETPSNQYSIRIDNQGERGKIKVGFCRKSRGDYYLLDIGDGQLGSAKEGDDGTRSYTFPIVNEDVITVTREDSTVSFSKNGVSLGVAFTDIPSDAILYPFITFYDKHQQITSISAGTLILPPLQWKVKDMAEGVIVTNSGTCVTNITMEEINGEYSSKVHSAKASNKFAVRIDNRGALGRMRLGFTRMNASRDLNVRTTLRVYFIEIESGCLTSYVRGAGVEYKDYCVPIMDGDVITVIREASTIVFKRNGVSLGVAFSDVPPDVALHPFVDFHDKNQQITSVPESYVVG
jgi:hypothetical protein